MNIIEIILKYLIPAVIQILFQLAAAQLEHYFPKQKKSPLVNSPNNPCATSHKSYKTTRVSSKQKR